MSRIKATTEGTENHTVSCRSRMKRDGPINWLAGITCREAPENQVMKRSRTEKSNEISCRWETRSCGLNRYCSFMAERNAETFPVETMTPLGDPVVPEVNMM